MDDTLCENFFRQPTEALRRRYEALRAVFCEHRPLPQVAHQYGYSHGSLRNLVMRFRSQCRCGQVPPFSPHPLADGLRVVPSLRGPCFLSNQRSPIAGNSILLRVVSYAAALPASSCFCRCWAACVLIS